MKMFIRTCALMTMLVGSLHAQQMPDQEDQTDIYAIPLDTSEAEEESEEKELQDTQKELKQRRTAPNSAPTAAPQQKCSSGH